MSSKMIFLSLFVLVVIASGETIHEHSFEDFDICNRCICSYDDKITTQDCANKGLTRMLRSWPPHNGTIRATFSLNNITSLDTLPSTNAVVEVVFSHCNIAELYAALFDGVRNIKVVDLSYNLLTSEDITPDKFIGPSRGNKMTPIALEDLNLAYNQIHTLDKDLFEYLPNLLHLNLEGNDFVFLDIHTQLALSSVPNLLSLNLANNDLTDLIVEAIQTYTSLVELDLSKNRLDFVPNALTHVGKTLETLILDDNPIIEFDTDTFLGLHQVQVLSANNLTKLKFINADTFVPLEKLKKLILCNNSLLEEIERQAFGIDQPIDELYISNNALYRIDYELLPWSKLRVLEVKNNPLECSCDLYKIAKALPSDIMTANDGPLCKDNTNGKLLEVYRLRNQFCTLERQVEKIQQLIQHHYPILMIMMVTLTVTVVVGAAVVALLGCTRRIKSRNYHCTYKQVPENKF